MNANRRWLVPALAAVLVAVVVLFVLFFRSAWAREFFFCDDLPGGGLRLPPLNPSGPWWQPGNNTGLPPRAGLAAVYADGYLYAIAGDEVFGSAHTDVYYSQVYTNILTPTGRLSDWQPTTPLPSTVYPEGVWQHDAVALTFTDTHKTFIYVFGGTEDTYPPSVYGDVVYAEVQADGTLGDWQETTPLPRALFGHESVVLSQTIYILGGADATGESRREVYYTRPDPTTGGISAWYPTTAPLPHLGSGGYFQAAAGVIQGRIYVYGGGSGLISPTYSYYVHFARPDAGGDITGWTLNDEALPASCFACEGAAYESGFLLAIAGAWSCDGGCSPSGAVWAAEVDELSGQTDPWHSTPSLVPERFFHAVTQDGDDWVYSIGGATGYVGGRINSVDIAAPGYTPPPPTGSQLSPLAASPVITYTPEYIYTSPNIDVRLIGQPWYHATLTSLSWNTTITDPHVLTVTMSYRYYSPTLSDWTAWSLPVPSLPGIGVTTTVAIPPGTIGDAFQYRAFLSTTVPTQTPILHRVCIGVLAPPDLMAMTLTVTGCDTCPGVIPAGEPVQVAFTVTNSSSSLPAGDDIYAMLFITTTPDYTPWPPACPRGCDCSQPEACPFIWPLQRSDLEEGDPPIALTTTLTLTTPGTYYLVAQVDYNTEPANPPPRYDVDEWIETNNIARVAVEVRPAAYWIYLPIVLR